MTQVNCTRDESSFMAGCRCLDCHQAYRRAEQLRELKAATDHGATLYRVRGCRCTICRGAVQDYARKWRQTAKVKTPRSARHGTPGMYTNRGCRCDKCREAIRAYNARLRRRKGAART